MQFLLIVIPTYNEEGIIKNNTLKLYNFCQNYLKSYDWQILIADNASTDKTLEIAQELSNQSECIKYFHLDKKGRGYALKKAWQKNQADIYCYLDADLSTKLDGLLGLLQAIGQGWDIAIGSRLIPGSQLERCLFRETISRSYNLIIKLLFNLKVKDAQCGFKAVNQKIVKNILPKVENNYWFFDTEMLILAERAGYKIKEVPVEWIEKRDKKRKSQVKVFKDVLTYLKAISKFRWRLWQE